MKSRCIGIIDRLIEIKVRSLKVGIWFVIMVYRLIGIKIRFLNKERQNINFFDNCLSKRKTSVEAEIMASDKKDYFYGR